MNREVERRDRADPALAHVARARLGRAELPARPDGALPARRRSGWSSRAMRTRTRARSASACPTTASPATTTSCSGRVETPNEVLDDLVLVRADGRPTYNFASPVEDWLDGITHVIRGRDHSRTRRSRSTSCARSARSSRLRTHADVARRRRQEALEAPRRAVARRVPRHGLRPRPRYELPRAARLELRRQDDDHVARRADRAVLLRPRAVEPGHVRLPEARLDERRLPARPVAGRVRGRPDRAISASRATTGTRSGAEDRAARPGETRAPRRVPAVRELPLPGRRARTRAARRRTSLARRRMRCRSSTVGRPRRSRQRCASSPTSWA